MITEAEIAPQADQPSHSAIGAHAYRDQESLRNSSKKPYI